MQKSIQRKVSIYCSPNVTSSQKFNVEKILHSVCSKLPSIEDEIVDLVCSWIQLKQILGFSNAPTAPLSYQLGSLKLLPLEILTLTVATFTSMPALGADWIFVRPHGQTPSGPTVVSLYWLVCWACLLNSSDGLSDNRLFDLNYVRARSGKKVSVAVIQPVKISLPVELSFIPKV